MTASDHRREYAARLNRAVNYIGAHLAEPLALRDLATAAAFSPYHFHRIFTAMMGETPGDFIWRLRAERAANLLLGRPRMPITEIAFACGFSSSSNFARAFKQRFGLSATAFRAGGYRNGGAGAPDSPPDTRGQGPVAAWSIERSAAMSIAVTTLPGYHVAYIRRLGYSKGVYQEHLNAAFQGVCRWAASQGLFRPETLVIGVPHDNPDITPVARCRYDACVTVPAAVTGGEGEVDIQDLPGGQYAVQRIDVDDPAEIGRLVTALYGEWLPASGYQADDRPSLEIYHDSGEPGPQRRIVLDYCLPVRPL
jgi:AraC family transcriptional regulator